MSVYANVPKHTGIAKSEADAKATVRFLVGQSCWFELLPIPDDQYEIIIKAESQKLLSDFLASLDSERELAELYLAHAREEYCETDVFSVDNDSEVSIGDDGGWVSIWAFFGKSEVVDGENPEYDDDGEEDDDEDDGTPDDFDVHGEAVWDGM